MFPTRVGMNRITEGVAHGVGHVPHTRGDEPFNRASLELVATMFPTRVGMNRNQSRAETRRLECSPHAWG